MRQRKLGSHTPPCHRRMVITTLFSVLLAALQRRPVLYHTRWLLAVHWHWFSGHWGQLAPTTHPQCRLASNPCPAGRTIQGGAGTCATTSNVSPLLTRLDTVFQAKKRCLTRIWTKPWGPEENLMAHCAGGCMAKRPSPWQTCWQSNMNRWSLCGLLDHCRFTLYRANRKLL